MDLSCTCGQDRTRVPVSGTGPYLVPDPDSESGTGRVRDRVRNRERNREQPDAPEQVVPDFLPKIGYDLTLSRTRPVPNPDRVREFYTLVNGALCG